MTVYSLQEHILFKIRNAVGLVDCPNSAGESWGRGGDVLRASNSQLNLHIDLKPKKALSPIAQGRLWQGAELQYKLNCQPNRVFPVKVRTFIGKEWNPENDNGM